MPGFLVRLAVNVLALWVADKLVPGMSIAGTGSFLLAALLLGVVNAVVRPLMVLLTLPATIFTLGLFLLVINAAMLGLVAALVDGFQLAGFWSAFFGALVVSLTSWFANQYVGPRGNVELLVVTRDEGR